MEDEDLDVRTGSALHRETRMSVQPAWVVKFAGLHVLSLVGTCCLN